MRFLDLFAGIGGFREGLMKAGHTSVGWCEIDKFAQQAYKIIHDVKGEWFANDIRQVNPEELPDFEILSAGFPCQSFSVAGNRKGFADTRGTLFFEIARIVKEKLPKILCLENVKGLLNHSNGETFDTILSVLDDLGYDLQWQVLNSKDFGVPQNRERVFIIGHIRGQPRPEVFPIREKNSGNLKEFSGGEGIAYNLDANYYKGTSPGDVGKCRRTHIMACLTPERINKRQNGRRFEKEGEPSFTLTKQDVHGVAIKEATQKGYDIATPGDSVNYQFPDSKTRRGRVGKDVANTLETSSNQRVLTEEYKIRKLTPLECFRLQGFPDEWYQKLKKANMSNTQLYKLAGNAVTVNVVEAIGKKL